MIGLWAYGAEPIAADAGGPRDSIAIDYPLDGSIFPPEITPPTFIWHDTAGTAAVWRIEVAFADGFTGVHAESAGPRPEIGEIDPRAVGKTNELPKLTPQEATAHTWTPDDETWAIIKKHSVAAPASVTFTGYQNDKDRAPISRGRVALETSKDPVGAPIFYRDVPLMPVELTKGVIKPLADSMLPLIAWRLRNIGQPRSRLLLQDMPVCANCHSFSNDGKTLGMDLDGPQNDKGLYVLASLAQKMSIRNNNVLKWNPNPPDPVGPKPVGATRVGLFSRVSPDGKYVVTTLNAEIYIVNFTDYRFLQVFYPTRGILAWYDRATGRKQPLPGADDPRYVQTNANWSPDGKYLVFSRAEARAAYPEGRKWALYPNDPNETPIQYDLYRIPFNGGAGGVAEPVAGASRNGMSNTFPKISPDGRWIVFVQCRNGQLMRPDGQLYIVPVEGGTARRMSCNTRLMNSWHSFSPNGRWLVFSSKSRSPYTRMFLTHLDKEGRDSPPIQIDNSTAANRAVNIPEFVNIPPDGLEQIDVPAAEQFRLVGQAKEAVKKGEADAAIGELRKALEIDPDYTEAHNDLGTALFHKGQTAEAITQYQEAIRFKPDFAEAHYNLGLVLLHKGQTVEAIAEFQEALRLNPDLADAHYNLGVALLDKGRTDEAITEFQEAIRLKPDFAQTHNDLGVALLDKGQTAGAITEFLEALRLNPDCADARANLDRTLVIKAAPATH